MIIQTMKRIINDDITEPLNPYLYDKFRQGKDTFNDFEVMVGSEKDGIVVVDKLTGERIMIKRSVVRE